MRNVLLGAVWSGAALLALLPGAAMAGYQIGEGPLPSAAASPAAAGSPTGTAGAGPIRLARFSFVQGNVTWREGDGAAWSPATVNLPIRQGAQVWVTNGGRAEVQFDDGSLLRLGNGAVATLQTLYSDQNGEFTELNLSEGLSALELRGTESIYQIDTPFVSVKSEGPSKVRIGVDSSVEVAVRLGKATVEGHGTKTTLSNGDYLNLTDAASAYAVNPLPDEDSWDHFNDDRDQQLADAESDHRLPSDIALVAGNLDDYGSWHDDPKYGQVWCPRETDANWRPYQNGHWVWVEPFGWTWVADEAWGWAPYHYGTWVSEPYGWGWCPGPARQYWCPAVVHFSEYDGGIAWAPLAPSEVRYPPSLALGFRGGNWSAFFSIGGAAVYYPHNSSYCEPRPFNNVTVNRITYVNNVTNIYSRPAFNSFKSTVVNRNIYLHSSGFVPINARTASGVTTASVAEFGGTGRYHPQASGGATFFTRGRSVGAPLNGFAPVAGPASVHPTLLAATASRSFLPGARSSAFAEQRPVFRAPLPSRVAQFAPVQRSSTSFSPRPGIAPFASGAVRANPGDVSRSNDVGRGIDIGRGVDIGKGNVFVRSNPVSRNNDFRPNDQARQNTGDQARRNALEARQSLDQPSDARSQDPSRIRIALPRENNPPRTENSVAMPREYRYRAEPGADSRPAASPSQPRAENRLQPRIEDRPRPRTENRPRTEEKTQDQKSQPSDDSHQSDDAGGGDGERGGRGRRR